MSIKEAISTKIDCCILTIGRKESPVFQSLSNNNFFISYEGKGLYKVLMEVISFIKRNNFEVIHSYDERAYTFAILASWILKIPFLHTKCGGVSRKGFPFCSDLILFSQENYHDFRSKKLFRKSNLHYIPNRVLDFDDDKTCIKLIKEKTKSNLTILRITRIGEKYEESIIQSINLVKELNKDGISSCLVIIGVIESFDIFHQLNSQYPEKVIFLTDKQYTENGKKCINASDIVIGTGRSLMEAAIKGKILVSPILGNRLPLLVNSNNIECLHFYNFSGRNRIENKESKMNYPELVKLVNNQNIRKKNMDSLQRYSGKYFYLSEEATNKYLRIYTELKYTRNIRFFSLLENIINHKHHFNKKNFFYYSLSKTIKMMKK